MSETSPRELRVKRYTEEVRRLEQLVVARNNRAAKAKAKLADAKDRLALAKKGRA